MPAPSVVLPCCDMEIEWLSTKQASDMLGVPLRTLYRLIDQGALPAYKVGRVIRLQRHEVEEYLRGREGA